MKLLKLTALLAALFGSARPVQAQAPAPGPDVQQLFEAFFAPQPALFGGAGAPQAVYQTRDLKNGYILATGPMEGWVEFVLWRKAGSADLVGVVQASCGPACTYSFGLYEYRDGAFTEVTGNIFPKNQVEMRAVFRQKDLLRRHPQLADEHIALRYVLPRQGTAIKAVLLVGTDGDILECPVAEVAWRLKPDQVFTTYLLPDSVCNPK